jgi:hypothetical protein
MLTPFLPISAPVDARGTSILNSFDSLERWVGGVFSVVDDVIIGVPLARV